MVRHQFQPFAVADICVDDIHEIVQKTNWEEAFFNLFNRVQNTGKRLLVTGDSPPKKLEIKLPDLTSRLGSGLIFQIHHLSDEEKLQALVKDAKLRGLLLPEPVAQFLVHHHPRDMKSLLSALEKLDQISLETKRKLTIPFVKAVLKI